MKKRFENTCILFSLVIVITLLSCKKSFLELRPPTAVRAEEAFRTKADLLVALHGAYAGLRAIDLFGRTVPVIGDVMADNSYISVLNSNRYISYYRYNVTPADGSVLGLWTNAYQVILRCNNIINADLTASDTVNQYKGEAHAVRALLYFTLVRFFAKPYSEDPNSPGVPIVKEYNHSLLPPRNTVAEVYAFVLNDLAKADSLMTQFINSSQFSKFAARALEAKVQLYKGDRASARTAALDVINNSGFTLINTTNYKTYWEDERIRSDKIETLFEVSSDAVANNGFDGLSYIYSQDGYGDLLCSSDLFALYSGTDVRRTILSTGTRGVSQAIFINKYPDIGGDRSDTKILRLSEMYLIAAEANLPGNEPDARAFLNYVAIRRDNSFSGYASSGSLLFENIIRERRKELPFEGDRFHDLNRLKRVIQRSLNYPGPIRTINYPDYRRVLPIPEAEMDANPNIQQNPGY